MAVDLSFVGRTGEPAHRSWEPRDAMLYALAVGAGGGDPSGELAFTTENSGLPQRVLPSFVCVATGAPLPDGFSIDMTRMLHAGMSFELFGDLAPRGGVTSVARIDAVHDKGSGALISTSTEVVDRDTGELLARLGSGMFVRGEGGFGGDRGPGDDWSVPDRDPDTVVIYETRPEQALLYRLTGDRNPLHSDPAAARRAGFDGPILHGMCTYGFTARALLHAVVDSDPGAFASMSARFSRTVVPGEKLSVEIWRTGRGALFRTLDSAGRVVLDRGRMGSR